MNKSPETTQPKRKLSGAFKRGLAGAALTVTAALAPGVATAQAEKGPVSEKLNSYIPTRVLEKRANQDMLNQRDLVAYNGVLIINSSYNNGGTEATPIPTGGTTYPNASQTIDGKVIEHPIRVFRSDPKNQFGHNDFTNGDYEYGKLIRGKKPHIELIKFDSSTMELVPWSMEDGPLVSNFIFLSDNKAGHLNLNEPLTSSDGRTKLHGGPLTDASGQPWKIGYEHPHPKG
jgi:hypothetical protein